MASDITLKHPEPWDKGKLVGQKVPFKPKEIWTFRIRLQMEHRVRELALFGKLRPSTREPGAWPSIDA